MHVRPLALLTLVSTLAVVACTPGDPHPDPRVAPDAAQVQPGTPPPPPAPSRAPVASDEQEPVRATIHHVNLSLVVDDPARSLEQAEELLRKLGGEVTYASSNGDNANLNGRVPVEARHRLRDALAQLGGTIQSENLSTSDVGHDVRRLQRRLVTIQHADAQVASLFGGQQDPAQVEAAALLRELTDRERQSIESQLESYRTQTRDGQVSVSFTRPTPAAQR